MKLSCSSKRLDEMLNIYEWILNLGQLLLNLIGESTNVSDFCLELKVDGKKLTIVFLSIVSWTRRTQICIALNSIWGTCDGNSYFRVFKLKRKFSQSIRSKHIEPIKGYSGTKFRDISSTPEVALFATPPFRNTAPFSQHFFDKFVFCLVTPFSQHFTWSERFSTRKSAKMDKNDENMVLEMLKLTSKAHFLYFY